MRDIAEAMQSRCSEAWAIDIHPAARLGGGLIIDHGTGVVIGETSIVGNDCTIMHGVTLGSSGKAQRVESSANSLTGDEKGIQTELRRHPIIGDRVFIGCMASIIGAITVGDGAKIGAGAIVLKSVPAAATAVGVTARILPIMPMSRL
jgi:serine O-acetyltransferase